VPGIPTFVRRSIKDVDGRDKPGHDGVDNKARRHSAPRFAMTC